MQKFLTVMTGLLTLSACAGDVKYEYPERVDKRYERPTEYKQEDRLFGADTLKFTGRYYVLDNTRHTRGLPWVAVDNDNGLLIALDHSKNANELIFYDIAGNMKYVKTVKLSETVKSIQGAEMYKGMLYAATNDDTQAIYKIDPVRGEVSKYFDRNLTKGSEGEGISRLVRESCDFMVSIPMYGALDSLNASVAAAVLMFEKRRQDRALSAK